MSFIQISAYISLLMIIMSIIISMYRLAKGPTLEDRVISLDFVTTAGIALIASFSIITARKIFIDVAIIIALLAFLGTVAFAYYLERRSLRDGKNS